MLQSVARKLMHISGAKLLTGDSISVSVQLPSCHLLHTRAPPISIFPKGKDGCYGQTPTPSRGSEAQKNPALRLVSSPAAGPELASFFPPPFFFGVWPFLVSPHLFCADFFFSIPQPFNMTDSWTAGRHVVEGWWRWNVAPPTLLCHCGVFQN